MSSRIYMQVATIGTISIYQVNADPNGVLRATAGSIAILAGSPPAVYQNMDGNTAWDLFISGAGVVTATPNAAGAVEVDPLDLALILVDTSQSDVILYLGPLRGGKRFVVVATGPGKVQLTATQPTVGVEGTAGATYLIDPSTGVDTVPLIGDTLTNQWRLAA